MRTDAKVHEYVAAVREVERLEAITPTEEFEFDLLTNIKAAKAKVRELYRTLRGSELGKARRILGAK